MKLDFSKCETKEDVDKILDEYAIQQIKTVRDLATLIIKVVDNMGKINHEKTTV